MNRYRARALSFATIYGCPSRGPLLRGLNWRALLRMELRQKNGRIAAGRFVFTRSQVPYGRRREVDGRADLGIGHAGGLQIFDFLGPYAHGRQITTFRNALSTTFRNEISAQ
jgi:hypothetical protein